MKCTLVLALTWSLTLAALPATSPPPSRSAAPGKPPAASKPPRDGGRFLFVVDTSSSMKSIDPATRQVVFDLIYSGIDGYMRDGDTFGLWTFDEEVGAGKFPMQVWNSEKPLEGASRAATFVRGQQYKGGNRMDDLMQKLTAVIRAVSNVNVFLITDGEAHFEGTPVDNDVNAAFERRAGERKAARKPFVTTLVARAGKIVRGTVSLPGEPIPLPARPESQKRAEKSVTPATTNALTTARPAAAPIHITATEKTSRAAPTAEADKPSPANQAEAPAEATASSVTAADGAAAPAESALANNTSAVAAPTNEAPDAKPRKVMQIITKPARPAEPEPAAEIAASAETNAAPQQATAPALPPVPASVPTPAAPPPPRAQTPVANLAAEVPAVASPAAWTTQQQNAAIHPVPQGLPVAARELSPPGTTPNDTAATGLAAMRVEPGLGAIPTLIIGGILLAMSLFLLGIALRRMRPEAQGSLITQSMHRR